MKFFFARGIYSCVSHLYVNLCTDVNTQMVVTWVSRGCRVVGGRSSPNHAATMRLFFPFPHWYIQFKTVRITG